MAQKGAKGNGGLKGLFFSGIILVLLCGFGVAWAHANNITDVTGVINYFRGVSSNVQKCGADKVQWDCSSSVNTGSSPISGPKSVTANGNTTASSGALTFENKENSLNDLKNVKVADADKNAKFADSDWSHWTGSPCDTRNTVLSSQGSNISKDGSSCLVTKGKWVDPYDGKTLTNVKDIDISFVVPPMYADQHGAEKWSKDKKTVFANDVSQLLAVSTENNTKKSDSGPSDWSPSNNSFKCQYAKMWVSTVKKYSLSITKNDKSTLESTLNTCQG